MFVNLADLVKEINLINLLLLLLNKIIKFTNNKRMASEIPTSMLNHTFINDDLCNNKTTCALVICGFLIITEIFTKKEFNKLLIFLVFCKLNISAVDSLKIQRHIFLKFLHIVCCIILKKYKGPF